ncbi:hypothetical protein CLF_102483 [Clonorchis sinensis]|uniref:Uncharacterized protein n=1 Tax=Clonorchis sinensis TaxID=79923 RepID=G7Y814_CLOSI|nr:hypothetical protein CLF_102483 [Clonorchis sinensis]
MLGDKTNVGGRRWWHSNHRNHGQRYDDFHARGIRTLRMSIPEAFLANPESRLLHPTKSTKYQVACIPKREERCLNFKYYAEEGLNGRYPLRHIIFLSHFSLL